MRFLREQLDDPEAADCGRCDNCGGLALTTEVAQVDVDAAREQLQVPGLPVAPRAQWPPGMASLGVKLSGKIPGGERAEIGRAVGRLDGMGWGSALRELFKPGAPDGETPIPLRHAAVAVFGAWPEAENVDGVVFLGSSSKPQLIEHLAGGMARYLKIPLLTRFDLTDSSPPPSADVNSAQRLRGVAHRHRLAAPGAVAGRRVLLVDDRTTTGWTLAVAARHLRQAGAEQVFPFVLGVG